MQIKRLKKEIEKDWGKKCPGFSPLCAVCLIWQAVEIIEKLYNTRNHITNWSKIIVSSKKTKK